MVNSFSEVLEARIRRAHGHEDKHERIHPQPRHGRVLRSSHRGVRCRTHSEQRSECGGMREASPVASVRIRHVARCRRGRQSVVTGRGVFGARPSHRGRLFAHTGSGTGASPPVVPEHPRSRLHGRRRMWRRVLRSDALRGDLDMQCAVWATMHQRHRSSVLRWARTPGVQWHLPRRALPFLHIRRRMRKAARTAFRLLSDHTRAAGPPVLARR